MAEAEYNVHDTLEKLDKMEKDIEERVENLANSYYVSDIGDNDDPDYRT